MTDIGRFAGAEWKEMDTKAKVKIYIYIGLTLVYLCGVCVFVRILYCIGLRVIGNHPTSDASPAQSGKKWTRRQRCRYIYIYIGLTLVYVFGVCVCAYIHSCIGLGVRGNHPTSAASPVPSRNGHRGKNGSTICIYMYFFSGELNIISWGLTQGDRVGRFAGAEWKEMNIDATVGILYLCASLSLHVCIHMYMCMGV